MADIYRIRQASTVAIAQRDGVPPQQAASPPDSDIAQRAIKLIPGDVIIAYASVKALFPAGNATATLMIEWVLPIAGLVLTIVLRIWGSRPKEASGMDKVQWPVVAFSALIYCGWVLSQGESLFGLPTDAKIGTAMLILFGIIPPVFYKGETS